MSQTPRDLLDDVLRSCVPDDLDLYPRIATRLERKSVLQTLRARPVMLILVVLLMLVFLSGVAYAVGRSLGYIPGVGILEQDVPVRALSQPVSVTRDGITWTVTQAVLSNDKSIVLYTLQGIPYEILSHSESEPGCNGLVYLRLPDGSKLEVIEGGGSPNETRFVFPPVVSEINEMSLVMPCILGSMPGKAPENWELHLSFAPATDLPMVEVVDIPTLTPLPGSGEIDFNTRDLLQLRRVIDVDKGFIFLLTSNDLLNPDGSRTTAFMSQVSIQDANGQPVFATYANDIDLGEVAQGANMAWAYRLDSKAYKWPLTFKVQTYQVDTQDCSVSFTFDTGVNPQPGQEWKPGQEIQVNGYTLHLVSARYDGKGYSFMFETAPEVDGIELEIAGAVAVGGGGGSDQQGNLNASLEYADRAPTGKLNITIRSLTTRQPGPLVSLDWQPETPSTALPALFGIQLQLDRYIPVEDGYYLIGHIEWSDERIQSVSPGGPITAVDESGRELDFEQASFAETIQFVDELSETIWVYRLKEKAFTGNVTLRLDRMNIMFDPAANLALDLRPFGFDFADDKLGIPYKTGLIPLNIPGIGAQLARVTYVEEEGMRGFDLFIEADPRLQGLMFQFANGVEALPGRGIRTGGGSFRDPSTGWLISRLTTDAEMSFPMTFFTSDAQISGDWSTTWLPPAGVP